MWWSKADGGERGELMLDYEFWAEYTFSMAQDRRHGERGEVQNAPVIIC
jgi:hypothetical protein